MKREIKFRMFRGCKMLNVDVLAISACTWDCPDHGKNGVSLTYQQSTPIMQFTGLHDKNGKEIYEGDIVDSWAGLKDNTEPYIRTVVWQDTGLRFEPLTGYNLCERNQHLFEVIGNIYEHPELLTSQTK